MNKGALGGILGVLLALSVGANVWLYLSAGKSKRTTEDVVRVTSLRDSLMMQVAKLDSLRNLLSSTQTDRQNLADKVDELESGGSVELRAQITDLQNKVAYYQNLASASGNAIQQAASDGKISGRESAKLSKMRKELEEKLKEIEGLNAQIAALTSERDQAVADRDRVKGDKDALESSNKNLQEKIGKNAVPQYGSLVTYGQATKSGKFIESYKLKGLEKFKITFSVLENELVSKDKPVTEEVTIRIVGPGGEVLSTENSSMQNSDDVYSLKKEIQFYGEAQDMVWYFPKTGKLNMKLHKGRYYAELWARGKMQQKNIFELN